MNLKNILYAMLVVLTMGMCSCDNIIGAGASALLPEDGIRVKADTFSVVSTLEAGSAIAITPDSFLLGECDTHFGTIKADILSQFACPLGFEYPYVETAEVDSVGDYLGESDIVVTQVFFDGFVEISKGFFCGFYDEIK